MDGRTFAFDHAGKYCRSGPIVPPSRPLTKSRRKVLIAQARNNRLLYPRVSRRPASPVKQGVAVRSRKKTKGKRRNDGKRSQTLQQYYVVQYKNGKTKRKGRVTRGSRRSRDSEDSMHGPLARRSSCRCRRGRMCRVRMRMREPRHAGDVRIPILEPAQKKNQPNEPAVPPISQSPTTRAAPAVPE